MRFFIFTISKHKNFARKSAAGLLIFAVCAVGNLFAQYRGAPVQKDRLLRALRSKQLQTGDIVTIIKRNGVDFDLTDETKKLLIAAGARPEVIEAVADNARRNSATAKSAAAKNRGGKMSAVNYDELLEKAIYSYREQKNSVDAVRFLQTAVKNNPANPAAYQMLGFVYLYGMNDYASSENAMRKSFASGGSAVFRVFHDDNGKFSRRCTGSLYISQSTVRFESDDNTHTFETSTANIDKFKIDRVSNGSWKNRSTFKVTLKFGKEEAKFRFSPLTGLPGESQMIARFVAQSNSNIGISNSAVAQR